MATEDDQSKSVADVKSKLTDPIKSSVKALSSKITAAFFVERRSAAKKVDGKTDFLTAEQQVALKAELEALEKNKAGVDCRVM